MRFSVLALLIALPAAAYAATPNNSNPKSCTQETQPCGNGLPACCGGNLDCRLDDKSQLVCFIMHFIRFTPGTEKHAALPLAEELELSRKAMIRECSGHSCDAGFMCI
jgi:hypothetical protein